MATLKAAYLGEDVPLRVRYEDANGAAVDPDDQDADASATPDAYITIRKQGASTPLVDSAAMSHIEAGTFEYVWDTAVTNDGTGPYEIETSADFSGETDIERITLPLR